MKKIILSLAALVATANVALYAQTCLSPELAYKVKNEGFSKSKIEEMAQFMTDDMGPRLAASQLKLRAEPQGVLIAVGLIFQGNDRFHDLGIKLFGQANGQ